jgi:hypothetical protein
MERSEESRQVNPLFGLGSLAATEAFRAEPGRHPDFAQELPRKLRPTKAKETQRRRREKRELPAGILTELTLIARGAVFGE